MLAFFAFLFSITLLGSVTIGPLSIRVYATIAMMLYILYYRFDKKQEYIPVSHNLLKTYILFIVFMGFAQLLNGEILEYQFFKKLLAYHLVAIVAFLSIERHVNTYLDLKRTIVLLTAIMLFNNITTILQYVGNDVGWSIGMLFGDIHDNADFSSTHESLLGYSRTPGIFGNVVNNAFAIAVFGPLPLCLLNGRSNLFTKACVFSSFITALVACFMTQQRAAFYLFLACFAVYLFVEIRRNALLIVVIGICVLFVRDLDFGDFDAGRLASAADDARSGLYKHAFAFIADHPVLGGPMSFQRIAGLSSHNVALDSWIFAGFLGFVTMMVLYFNTLRRGLKIFARGLKIDGQNRYMIFCATAVISAMVYGFTHNTSYLTGNVIIFIVLALMLKTSNIDTK